MSTQATKLPKGMSLSPIAPENPADLGYDPGLPVELALGLNGVTQICEEYGIGREELEALANNPMFRAEFEAACDTRTEKGGAFRLKAQLMAEKMLEELFKIGINPEVGPAIRVKIANDIIEYAGRLPARAAAGAADLSNALQININLNGAVNPAIVNQDGSPAY